MTGRDADQDELMRLLSKPTDVEGLGLSESLCADIVLRRLLQDRQMSLGRVAEATGLVPNLVNSIVEGLKHRQMLEYVGMNGRDPVVVLSEQGRNLAASRAEQCAYSSVAPVPLDQYVRVVELQQPVIRVDRERMQAAFSDLVVPPAVLDQLGPGIMADGAIFMYGPAGTGKTSLAERLVRTYGDEVAIPRAIEVDSQIIIVFDPAIHKPLPHQPAGLDPRWIICERPSVIVGGELTVEMLDLDFDRTSGIYQAPLSLKANNGILVVDDFGRQVMSPDELLNRWIVPLSRGVDFLMLAYGVKFQVPFATKVVVSTNLDPNKLGDEAFLRRMPNKIYIGAITDEDFNWILSRVAKARGVECDASGAAYLRDACKARTGDLRPYQPVDVCELLSSICRYEGTVPALTPENIDRVVSMHYAHVDDNPMPDAKMTSKKSAPARPDHASIEEQIEAIGVG